jgi:hypothetical protein
MFDAIGRHAAEWYVNGQTLPGEFNADPMQPATFEIFGEVEPTDPDPIVVFPKEYDFAHLVGRLRSGQDVILTDAHVLAWVPERATGSARLAVVGLGIADVANGAFARVRLQVTGSDLFFGAAPISRIFWPSESAPADGRKYSAELNPDSHHRWESKEHGLVAECSYESSFVIGDRYRHQLTFAPVVELTSHTPLSVDEWLTRWIVPLLGLAALATRNPQQMSWLTVHDERADGEPAAPAWLRSGLVVGSGIAQARYDGEERDEWRHPDRHPLFTLASIPMPLPELLHRWRTLGDSADPFVELYQQVLRLTDLPQRARFLYMIQALEALHTHENKAVDETAQKSFEAKRMSALAELEARRVAPLTMKFVRKNWTKRRQDSLDHRLADLIRGMPEPVRAGLRTQEMDAVARYLDTEASAPLHVQLSVLRNALSHGDRNYEARDLRPWVLVVETMCRSNLLRLLGFDESAIGTALATRRATRNGPPTEDETAHP